MSICKWFNRHAKHRSALYIQFTNPAGYPPLEYSSEILVESGYKVRFIGIRTVGTEQLCWRSLERREVCLWTGRLKILPMKAYYLAFIMWGLVEAYRQRPDVIYLSDINSVPIGWLLTRLGWRNVIYHEHDSPEPTSQSNKERMLQKLRNQILPNCAAVVVPNHERLRIIEQQTSGSIRGHCVWNCPRHKLSITSEKDTIHLTDDFRMVFHGSITPERLPSSIFYALARVKNVNLDIIGYEAPGARGFIAELQGLAESLGISKQVRFYGSMPHDQVLEYVTKANLGVAFLTHTTSDINRRYMAGASNKVFDNLALRVPILVSDDPQWQETFVKAGVALACDPLNADAVTELLRWCLANPKILAEMGERGAALCHSSWNYDEQFRPVFALIEAGF